MNKPGPGWTQAGASVWDHVSGIRVHESGMVRLADGRIVIGSQWPESRRLDACVRMCGGNVRRGAMVWALKAAKAAGGEE